MTFTPDRTNITAITQANPCVVTTDANHGLSNGNVVRLLVPPSFGMFQLNKLLVQALVLSPTTFSAWYSLSNGVPVNTINFPAFTVPANPGFLASVIPVGSGPTPESDVAWQALNGFCDTPIDDAVLNNSTVQINF